MLLRSVLVAVALTLSISGTALAVQEQSFPGNFCTPDQDENDLQRHGWVTAPGGEEKLICPLLSQPVDPLGSTPENMNPEVAVGGRMIINDGTNETSKATLCFRRAGTLLMGCAIPQTTSGSAGTQFLSFAAPSTPTGVDVWDETDLAFFEVTLAKNHYVLSYDLHD